MFSYQEDTLLVKLHDSLQHSSLESIHMLEKLVLPNIILHITQKGYLNFIKDLNDNGIDINQSDFEGRNSYHIAARENNLNMIRYLLEKSVSFIFIFLIFFLLDVTNIDKMDNSGKTPLYEALAMKNKNIVYELKNKGACYFGKKSLVRNLLFK